MMTVMVLKKTISLIALLQMSVLLLSFYSVDFFINFEVALISSVLIMFGSMYSYSKLVQKRLDSGMYDMSDSDDIDKLDDPYDLYSEAVEDETPPEDVKSMIKEEKARLKVNTVKNFKTASPALISVFRLLPYLFLVMGFMALNNNEMLLLVPYLTGLGFGVVVGLFIGKLFFIPKSEEC